MISTLVFDIIAKKMQPFVLELDMAYAKDIMEKQKIAMQEMGTTIQRKNLKLASILLKSGQLDRLTQKKP